MRETINPSITPQSVPIARPAMTAITYPKPLLIRPAQSVPERAMTEPTERSMPPVIMTKVIPKATMAVVEMDRSMVRKLRYVRNLLGTRMDRIRHKTRSAASVPEFSFIKRKIGFLISAVLLLLSFAIFLSSKCIPDDVFLRDFILLQDADLPEFMHDHHAVAQIQDLRKLR